MARKKGPDGEPTRMEMQILQVLWEHGPCTVRFVNEELNKGEDIAYTSTLKIMQLMYEKGLLLRDASAMTHIYIAAIKEEQTKKHILKGFVNFIYKGSASELIVQLLGSKKPTKEELTSLKELLKKYEKNGKAKWEAQAGQDEGSKFLTMIPIACLIL